MDEREAHQYFAIQAFNSAWELIDKTDRTPDDENEMLERAFSSRWHWGFVGGPEQTMTGDWQIAHCAALIGLGVLSQVYAERALRTCEHEGWGDWQRASMLEGVARAHAAAGDKSGHAKYYALAQEAVAAIAGEQDRALIASQLATVPRP